MRGAYGQWAAWLGDFALGRESEELDSLPPLRIEDLGSVAAARLSQRCAEALSQRLRLWSERFSRDLERARRADDLRQALGSARSRLNSLRALASSPLLFEELRTSMERQLQEVLERAQQDLERELERAGSGEETLLRIAREQPLDRAVLVSLPAQSPEQPGPSTTRRVLLG
jgi:hypothetical protein